MHIFYNGLLSRSLGSDGWDGTGWKALSRRKRTVVFLHMDGGVIEPCDQGWLRNGDGRPRSCWSGTLDEDEATRGGMKDSLVRESPGEFTSLVGMFYNTFVT